MISLHQIMQKEHETVNKYNVHFNTFIAEALIVNANLDSNMLQQYLQELRKSLIDQLLSHMAASAPLSIWQASALKLDNCMQMIKQLRFCTDSITHPSSTNTTHQQVQHNPNAMDINAVKISCN